MRALLATVGPALVALLATAPARPCAAHDAPALVPPGLDAVTVEERLGERVPADLAFRDHTGRRVLLSEVLPGDRPVLLNLVYHDCTTFCSLVLDGVAASLNQQGWTAGVEFDVVTVSIDPRDTPEVAARARARTLAHYARDAAREGWHFLVAERSLDERENLLAYGIYPEAQRLAAAVGFGYEWMPRTGQYAHPGVIMLLTPDGRVARYLYGLEYRAQDVRLGLLEASEGRSVSTLEHVLLYCYAYNANAQGYTLVAWNVMRAGGGVTALALFAFLGFLFWRDKKRQEAVPASPGGPLVRIDR
ncbi:MAG: SCO family protein [Sandaracinaceae bacterium]|nr:SCO family protein [Sandaracinaceae bacterium]